MKKTALFTSRLMTLMVVIAMAVICTFAFRALSEPSYAEVSGKGYSYTIKVYAGLQGEFEDGKKVWTKTVQPGEEVTISEESTGFKLTNNEYYVRGFREAGHDNDEQMKSQVFVADEDRSFEVAYGIAGGMVKYEIQYVDENGVSLRDSDTYYGMVGDKPVVSYKYVDNYRPQAYHVTKTLTDNESENVFVFTYTPIVRPEDASENEEGNSGNETENAEEDETADEEEAATEDEDDDDAAANRTNAGTAAGTQNGAAGNGTVPGNTGNDGNVDDGIADIDDQDTPSTAPENGDGENGETGIDDNATPASSPAGKVSPAVIALISGTAALGIAFIAIAVALLKKRKDDAEAE